MASEAVQASESRDDLRKKIQLQEAKASSAILQHPSTSLLLFYRHVYLASGQRVSRGRMHICVSRRIHGIHAEGEGRAAAAEASAPSCAKELARGSPAFEPRSHSAFSKRALRCARVRSAGRGKRQRMSTYTRRTVAIFSCVAICTSVDFLDSSWVFMLKKSSTSFLNRLSYRIS